MTESATRKATFPEVLKMVMSAFLGIRKRSEHERLEVSPVQVVAVGVLAGLVFVMSVILVVRLVLP